MKHLAVLRRAVIVLSLKNILAFEHFFNKLVLAHTSQSLKHIGCHPPAAQDCSHNLMAGETDPPFPQWTGGWEKLIKKSFISGTQQRPRC